MITFSVPCLIGRAFSFRLYQAGWFRLLESGGLVLARSFQLRRAVILFLGAFPQQRPCLARL